MTRYAYDPLNFRLLRIRSEKCSQAGNTYAPSSASVRARAFIIQGITLPR